MNEQPTGAPGPEQQPPDDQGGYDIVIHIAPTGEITVDGQPVASLDEALEAVQGIHDAGDQAPTEQEGQDMADAMEGYGRGGLRGMPVNKVLRDDR